MAQKQHITAIEDIQAMIDRQTALNTDAHYVNGDKVPNWRNNLSNIEMIALSNDAQIGKKDKVCALLRKNEIITDCHDVYSVHKN